jgi:hypothetical protein
VRAKSSVLITSFPFNTDKTRKPGCDAEPEHDVQEVKVWCE